MLAFDNIYQPIEDDDEKVGTSKGGRMLEECCRPVSETFRTVKQFDGMCIRCVGLPPTLLVDIAHL